MIEGTFNLNKKKYCLQTTEKLINDLIQLDKLPYKVNLTIDVNPLED